MKFGYVLPSGFRGEVVRKCGLKMEASHAISSPRSLWLRGTKKKHQKTVFYSFFLRGGGGGVEARVIEFF